MACFFTVFTLKKLKKGIQVNFSHQKFSLVNYIYFSFPIRNTTERIGAQAMFIISIILMSLGTFVHLQGKDNNVSQKNILVPQVPPNIIEPLITQPPDIGKNALKT